MIVQPLKDATQRCMQLFASVCAEAQHAPTRLAEQIPAHVVVDEYDRFTIWSGNLGARQKGHASLDWRLRDAEVMTTTIQKLLGMLGEQLEHSHNVLLQKRKPYEEQTSELSGSPAGTDSEDSDDGLPELGQRWQTIVATIRSLYKLSYSIRRPGARVASRKAELYREPIPGSEVEYGDCFQPFDRAHVVDLLNDLRATAGWDTADDTTHDAASVSPPTFPDADEDPITDLLTSAITKRRRKFRYWARHKQKLAQATTEESRKPKPLSTPQMERRSDELPTSRKSKQASQAPPQSQGPLTETEATRYILMSVPEEDAVSIAPSASTARDVEGHVAKLPEPPETHGQDWECHICFVLCPAKEASGHRWRKHILEDLQPYLCTYLDCPLPNQIYGSRTAWLAHEDTYHRLVWRCRDHRDTIFTMSESYTSHLHNFHPEVKSEHIQAIVDSSVTAREDSRTQCPLCLVPTSHLRKGQTLLQHIANHLERISCFAIPRTLYYKEDDEDASDSLRIGLDDASQRWADTDYVDHVSQGSTDTGSTASPDRSEVPEIITASQKGLIDVVQACLQEGADANAQGGRYGNALESASVNGHTDVVRALLRYGADANAQGGEHGNALTGAAYNGHHETAAVLLESGADVNAEGGICGNALQAASKNRRNEALVRFLLNNGAHVNKQGGFDGNALQAACDSGNEAIVRLLLEKDADVNAQGGYYGNALQAACVSGRKKIVGLLLDENADVNALGGKYGTALQGASLVGPKATVRSLLDKNADVNAQGGEYGNALQADSSKGHEAIVRILLHRNADVNAQGGAYKTALRAALAEKEEWPGKAYAALRKDYDAVVQVLLDHGAQPLEPDETAA